MSNDFSESGPVNIGAGEEWLVLTCRQCRKTLLIEPVSPEMLDEDGAISLPASSLEVECPHCEFVSTYRSDEIRIETGSYKQ